MFDLRAFLAVSAVLLATGCAAGQVDDTTGPDTTTTPVDTTGNGTVQRGTLTVRVGIDNSDKPIATAAGVTVQGLTVRITRAGSTEPPRSAQTDANGSVQFTQLLQGTYTISVDRPLSPSEIQNLPVEERDISLFAAGAQVTIAPPSREVLVSLVASRRGSLVLSELHNRTVAVGGSAYAMAHYFEVYNNGDTTAYLDGVLLVRRAHVPLGSQVVSEPCETVNAAVRLDPDGIWATSIYAFPGSGRSFPVQPGEARVVAVDAADHSFAGLPDLSRAQFEFIGTEADPDNPSAANMTRIRGVLIANFGHGESVIAGSLYALALPVARDTTELLQSTISDRGNLGRVFQIPRVAILDAVGAASATTFSDFVLCSPFAAPHFERSPSRLFNFDDPRPIRRRSLGRTADGREILQRTGNAERDFELTFPLRRSLNK